MSRVPNPRAPHTSMPIQHSQPAIRIHARIESGGIVKGRRFQGLISGQTAPAIAYPPFLRVLVLRRASPDPSIVITLLAP
jgi:hypothetical protein